MRGRRVYPGDDGAFKLERPGDYGRDTHGQWWAWAPCSSAPGESRAVGVLTDHEIEEHEDYTITVTPSLVFGDRYHGWLRRGEWTDA
jgi:hypothetical protein